MAVAAVSSGGAGVCEIGSSAPEWVNAAGYGICGRRAEDAIALVWARGSHTRSQLTLEHSLGYIKSYAK